MFEELTRRKCDQSKNGVVIYRLDNSPFSYYRFFTIKVFLSAPSVNRQTMNDKELAAVCKALGSPIRISILKQLLVEEKCICGSIVEILPLAQSTVSQHLKVLKDAGVVMGEVSGSATCYCLNRQTLIELKKTIQSLLNINPIRDLHE